MEHPCRLPLPRRRGWQVFWLCFAAAALLLAPHCLVDAVNSGFFHYAGDFNDQMIPFYAYANAFLKHGGSFSWATDLGSGFLNTYSYYCLGSPFFWLTLPVPARWMPFTMAPMLCLKFAVAGSGAYRWARRWLRGEEYAMLAGCLYAFCGFNVYNIFFYFFLDAAALFPWLLAAVDGAVFDGRRGCVPFWAALCLLNNYFFFIGQAVFLLLYLGCMWFSGRCRPGPARLARLAGEALLGVTLGCVLAVPSLLSLLQNPRAIDPFNGRGYLLYGSPQQYGAILYSALLMPDAPYLTDLFDQGVTKWTSLSAYLPVLGVAGGLAFCRLRRRHPFTRILRLSLLMALVPVLNSLFFALNSSYYARWFYMPLLVLCAASAAALESPALRRALPHALRLTALAAASAVLFALLPWTDPESGERTLGVVSDQARFWGLWLTTMAGLGLFAWLLRRREARAGVWLAAVLGFSLVYGSVHISIAKYDQWTHDADYVAETWAEAAELDRVLPAYEEDGFYRIDAYECYGNLGIWLDRSCIQHFNSTVAPHILEFYPSVGVKRDVNSLPAPDLFALRGLLSVRFTLMPLDKEAEWLDLGLGGWTRYAETTHYAVYENHNWLPPGIAHDYALTAEAYEAVEAEQRAALLLKAAVLPQGQSDDLLTPLPAEAMEQRSYSDYAADVAARRADAVTRFTATRDGFAAAADYDRPRLVVFAVPYDDGFTAAVNGQPADIQKVDHGLMAVHVPAGHSEIVFTYRAPGLALGAMLSLTAALLYLLYLIWLRRRPAAGKEEE